MKRVVAIGALLVGCSLSFMGVCLLLLDVFMGRWIGTTSPFGGIALGAGVVLAAAGGVVALGGLGARR